MYRYIFNIRIISIVLFGVSICYTSFGHNVNAVIADNYIEKVEVFFNKIKQLSANFIQTNKFGDKNFGNFLIKNKKLKLEYKDLKKTVIIKDNKLIIYDKNLQEKTVTSIYSSPFYFLLKPNFKLKKYFTIINIEDSGKELIITLRPKNDNQYLITIYFRKEPFIIKGWEIYDENLYSQKSIKIDLTGYDFNKRIDEKEFDVYD